MKFLRLLVLLGAVAVGVLALRDYRASRAEQAELAAEAPEAIAADLSSKAGRWRWSQQTEDSPKVDVYAESFRQGKESSTMELSAVELRVFHDDERVFDRIESPAAVFDLIAHSLYSDGKVVVTLAVPTDAPDSRRPDLTVIETSGVTFLTETGSASTDRPVHYEFDGGTADSLGADYDSMNGSFRMRSQVRVRRFAASPGGGETVIRAAQLDYYERAQRVDLRGAVSLERGSYRIDAEEATIHLERGAVRRIEALRAEGEDRRNGRIVRFRTPRLEALYSEAGTIEQVTGFGPSVLTSKSAQSSIRADGRRIRLVYRTAEGESDSVLDEAFIDGDGRIESLALGRDRPSRERRLISAEALHLKMKPDGRDVELIETFSPGRIEIVSGPRGEVLRDLRAERIKAFYGAKNVIERLLATGKASLVSRDSESDPELRTWSDAFEAHFDPLSGELRRLRQWVNFRFEQGDRSGAAEQGVFLTAENRMSLTGRARLSDPGGTVSAHQIDLDQEADLLIAETGVSARYRQRKPDAERAAPETLFESGKPLFASARKMVSNQTSGVIEYEGHARLWQGGNRIEAERILIRRREQTLLARGDVFTLLVEQGEEGRDGPVATIEVRADSLDYSERNRLAAYRGRVRLRREALRIQARELDAVLADPKERFARSSRLESAVARGDVRIQEAPGKASRARKGFAEFGEYRPERSEVLLRGSPARVHNARNDETRGAELIYLVNDDRLQVLGGESAPAYTYRGPKSP